MEKGRDINNLIRGSIFLHESIPPKEAEKIVNLARRRYAEFKKMATQIILDPDGAL